MLEEILPSEVVAAETREDAMDVVLFPAEEVIVGQAVEKRRREFTTVRACAREAFARLGLPAVPVTSGERGEPQWPSGVVGSITHCESYRACALARSHEIATVGIDAEPNAPLPDGVLEDIARAEELPWLERLHREEPAVHWDRLLFSAKESVYKAWFPLARRWLGFEDAIVTVDSVRHTFSARLLVPGPAFAGLPLEGFCGRWLMREGLVLTAIALAAAPPST
ncbi:MAG: 4'-phosphopantetheinyl transferase superfamily protein [Solirubrobacteraceae bacterium]